MAAFQAMILTRIGGKCTFNGRTCMRGGLEALKVMRPAAESRDKPGNFIY
ncbi:hypothetical protein NC652_016212 [Populus alba x Populus x berolinensis]|nr:hypothetical protein NC651_015693 [Populus alba x Populus x berolinensis]KAJ6922494.1 hypothetical protein NC652_016212 [Populus alba x Populus x berolinensis]